VCWVGLGGWGGGVLQPIGDASGGWADVKEPGSGSQLRNLGRLNQEGQQSCLDREDTHGPVPSLNGRGWTSGSFSLGCGWVGAVSIRIVQLFL
jgi:hypothetical protein